MSNRSYLVPRPPAFDHEHPRPKEEGEVLYCGNCSKWYVSWFPLTEIIHEEWQTASEWIRDGYVRQAIEVLAAADQAQPASADGGDYEERMRVEYRELTARAGRLRDMLQRYADGTLDFEPTCPITLLSRQLDVMDEYAGLLRHRAKLEHVDLEEQDSATE